MELAVGKLATIDVIIITVYLVGITVTGSLIGRFIKSDADFFLGGRNLPWWAIGMSMVVSDIGALELVGVAGMAYTFGIAVSNFDWIGCIPAMVLAAFIFVPYYWRSKVFTVPEFLGLRYNQFVRSLVALIWGIFFLFMLGIFFYTAAKTMHILCGWPIMFSVILIATVVGIYTFFGGLAAVVYLDSIQCVILFFGSFIILSIAMLKVGGWGELISAVTAMGPEFEHHFQLIVPADTATPLGWASVVFGLTFVLSPAYWLGNQAIVQRALGARSEYEAKKSVLWGAFLKLFIPIILVGPGIAGVALHPGLAKGDDIFPTLMHDLLPPGLTGIVFAAFLAALISSVDSYLNSAATLWTKDIYQKYFVSDRNERHYMIVGKVLTVIFVVIGIFLARLTENFSGIFTYMQTMLSIFQGPLLAIIVLGFLWRRANAKGAIAGLALGVTTSSTLFLIKDLLFTTPDPFLYIAWWAFLVGLTTTVIVSLFTEPEPPEKIEGLIYSAIPKIKESQVQ
ncbi:MAG TPA: sodium/solute symporter [archaeon]|nr:sodium/solute symporter [archaeon]